VIYPEAIYFVLDLINFPIVNFTTTATTAALSATTTPPPPPPTPPLLSCISLQHVLPSLGHYCMYMLMLKLLHCHLSMLDVNFEVDFRYSKYTPMNQ
jgi:hypothetical protein